MYKICHRFASVLESIPPPTTMWKSKCCAEQVFIIIFFCYVVFIVHLWLLRTLGNPANISPSLLLAVTGELSLEIHMKLFCEKGEVFCLDICAMFLKWWEKSGPHTCTCPCNVRPWMIVRLANRIPIASRSVILWHSERKTSANIGLNWCPGIRESVQGLSPAVRNPLEFRYAGKTLISWTLFRRITAGHACKKYNKMIREKPIRRIPTSCWSTISTFRILTTIKWL